MTTGAPQVERAALPAVVRLGWSYVRSTAGFGWRLVQRQAPPALTAGPLGRVARSRTSAVLRSAGRDVEPSEATLMVSFPHATGRLLVFVPDSTEDESVWQVGQEQYGGTYASRLAPRLDWTPVHVRAAAPSGDLDRAAELGALLQRVVDHWPEPVERIALVAHGDGGLALRAAAGVRSWTSDAWQEKVSDVVLLGTPHLWSDGERSLAVSRQLDEDLAGIVGSERADPEVEPIPGAIYTVITRAARLERNVAGSLLGSLLWWRDRAALRRRVARQLFPTATVVHVEEPGVSLANHPEVQQALIGWLA
ncbi:esterase/lipase family protein [Nocardioides alcanivorans]|uniref:esterase/lipase family protein n=1 Tax=Nocardioides alcanivorans TaxID=2897352 RepID=UPI001F2940AE|nr:hypothetical protein [Nocardioides alcanivorans]